MKLKIKPRNPFVVLAKFRKAGAHTRPAKSLRQRDKQLLAKEVKQSSGSCQNRADLQFGSAIALITAFEPVGVPTATENSRSSFCT